MDKTFIVAELSANHQGSKAVAIETIRAAKKAGADAVKLQTYTADTLTLNCRNEYFKVKGGLWDQYCLYDLYQEAYTPWEWHEELFRVAREEGLVCFSTPFDRTAVDFLESLQNPIYKIASFEITDPALIEYVAGKRKPMIISTGIALKEEIQLAVETCRKAGNTDVTLLKCTSAYPATAEEANLRTLSDMKREFQVEIGVSDHSLGDIVALTAVALGAKVVEKHFILDRRMGGADAAFSMEPEEFKRMCERIREVEMALGEVYYPEKPENIKGREFCRSLFVAKDMKAGEMITEENVRSVRPGFGLSPKYLSRILGKRVNRDLEKGLPFQLDFVNE